MDQPKLEDDKNKKPDPQEIAAGKSFDGFVRKCHWQIV
jgi:hypothetical protein